jgi:uncharacterized protein
MKIPIDDISQSPKEIRVSESIEALNEVYANSKVREYRFPPSLDVDLAYYRAGQQLFFHGRFSGTLQASCSRCLQNFSCDLNKEFDFVLSPSPAHPGRGAEELNRDDLGLSYYSTSTEEIDLAPLITEQVILALPTRPLCAEDCRGICGGCGANLNVEACVCSSSAGDPRMAIFRTLKVGR